MKTIRLQPGWFLIILTLSAYFPASAQRTIWLGPQLGINKATDSDGARVLGGAALRLRWSQVLGIEGSISYREEEYHGKFVEVWSWPIMVTGLVYPIPAAYGAIGVGWYNTSIDYNFPPGYLGGPAIVASETKQKFGWHLGGGVEVYLGEVAKLVGDIRYVFLDHDFQSIPGADGLETDFYAVTAGILFGL